MDDDLIAAHAEVEALMPYLHLPVQSGSDRILQGDEPRPHGGRLSAPDRARSAPRGRTSPCPATSSSAFPARRDADFEATLRLVREVGYASAFSFKYSRRPGTPAAAMPGQVAEAVKDERLARLQALLDDQQAAFNAGQVGRDPAGAVRAAGPPSRPDGRPQPLSAAGAHRRRRKA